MHSVQRGLNALNRGVEKGGYVTNNETKREARPEQVPQVVEGLVELVGIEPTTSSLRIMKPIREALGSSDTE